MTGTRIPIQADVSGVNKSLDDLKNKIVQVNQAMAGGKASIDISQAKQSLRELDSLAEEFGKTLQESGSKVGLNAVEAEFEKAAQNAMSMADALKTAGVQGAAGMTKNIEATQKLSRELIRARKLQEALKRDGVSITKSQAVEAEHEFQRRVSAGGRGARKFKGKGLDDVVGNWRDLAMNETDARRERRDLLRNLGLTPGGGGAGASGGRGFGQFFANSAGAAGRNVFHAASPNMSGGSSILSNAAQEASATEGGMFSGAGMARLGAGAGIAAAAVLAVKGIQAVKAKMDDAEQEGIGYADLSRSMGGAATDFDALRKSVRDATIGMGVAYTESAKIAKAYLHGAGVDGMAPGALNAELRTSYGFARGMGQDPSQSADFFATMRHNKVSSGDADNRRIALLLADSISKAGVFTKADAVMQAVGQFTATATRASFASANVGGYAGQLTGMMGLGLPGLDPSASASLLGKVDAGIRGNKSEAFRNFFLGTMQQAMPGLDAVDMGLMQDQGAFGTAQDAFGRKSAAYRMAQASGDKPYMGKLDSMAKSGGGVMNIDRVMQGLKANSINSSYMKENLKGAFGMSDSESAAMIAAYAQSGSIRNSLGEFSDVDISKMNPQAIKSLVTIKNGTNADRRSQAKRLQGLRGGGALNGGESADLTAALSEPGADDSKLKSVLMRLTSTRDMEKTDGDQSRENMADIANATASLATQLIPISNSIREAVVSIAQRFGFKDTYGLSQKSEGILNDRLKGAGDDNGKRLDVLRSFQRFIGENPDSFTPAYRDKVQGMLFDEAGYSKGDAMAPSFRTAAGDSMISAKARAAKSNSTYDDLFAREGSANGIDPMLIKAVAAHESSLNPKAFNLNGNGSVDRGIMQLNSRFDKERGVTNPYDVNQNVKAGASFLASNMRKSNGDVRTALRKYNGSGPAAEQYADNVLSLYEQMKGGSVPAAVKSAAATPTAAMPVPEGGRSSFGREDNSSRSIMFQHEITLKDRMNQLQADPLMVTSMFAPKPAGVFR